ncbi:hypothetical protein [Pyrococcus kukulkanii]|uniref:DUF4352 domain-containing protein n=2 Tax=Pyrococcus kukulkanii TaxID=1609559 RepID=A0ABV4T6X4_9EURY
MRKTFALTLALLIVISAGCLQSQGSKPSPTQSPTTSPITSNPPKKIIESISIDSIDVIYNEEADALIIYLKVRNQTNYTRIDGILNLTIKDKYGFLIYNGSIEVKKADFKPYIEEFMGLDDKLHNITYYKARYIIPHPRKGLARTGYIHAILIVGNQTLKRDFIAYNLPEMSDDEKKAYFESLYLNNSRALNISQKHGELQVEVYRYGIYTSPRDLKKYLRIDLRIRNTANYTVEIEELTLGPLVVDGYPVKEVDEKEYFLGDLEPGEFLKGFLLFPMSEIPLNHKNLILKLGVEEYLPEKEVLVTLDNLPIEISRWPFNITISEFTTGTVEFIGTKETVANVTVLVRNNKSVAEMISFLSWELSGESPSIDSKVPYEVPARSTAKAILVYYFDQKPDTWKLKILIPSTSRKLEFTITIPPLQPS